MKFIRRRHQSLPSTRSSSTVRLAVVGFALALVAATVAPAMAARAPANGYIEGPNLTYFNTTRSHDPNQPLSYLLSSYRTECGSGGNLSLRPLRTSNNYWMAGWLRWPVGVSGSPNSAKSWGGPRAISGGNFRLVGQNSGWCGAGTSKIWFYGTITY